MAQRVSPREYAPGLRPIHELNAAWAAWPLGDRAVALQVAAERFKMRFKEQGQVGALRSVDMAAAPYRASLAFQGAARTINPYVSVLSRMLVIRFQDHSGIERLLVWAPTVPAGAEAPPLSPEFASIGRQGPLGRFRRRVLTRRYNTLEGSLAACGVRAELVDFLAFDHLRGQDPRVIVPPFPNSRLIVQDRELAALEAPHPMQRAWYVDGGLEGIDERQLLRIDGSVELGRGVAIVAKPGHADGHQSLVVNTEVGAWVSSANGVSADNWQPDLSRIPGVRRYSRVHQREVCPSATTLEDAIDQDDSMVLEKQLADVAAGSPWLQILPSCELVAWRQQWPVVPTHSHGPLNVGRIAPADFGAARAVDGQK